MADTKTISNIIKLSFGELGIDTHVFDKSLLNINYLGLTNRLNVISAVPSTNYIDNLIIKNTNNSELESVYERIEFPVFLIDATLKEENDETLKNNGALKGIIRPKLITSLLNKYTKPIKGEMPEFHFYLFDSIRGIFEGKSNNFYDYELTKGITCGLKLITKNEIRNMDNCFEANVKNSEIYCSIYYTK